MFLRNLLFLLAVSFSSSQSNYFIKFIQASPGQFNSLKKELLQMNIDLLLQHKQGESWDFMIVEKLDQKNKVLINHHLTFKFKDDISAKIIKQEDIIVKGPNFSQFDKILTAYKIFHIESFDVLPGKELQLYKEREMENEYFKEVDFAGNLIFTRILGSEWDLITIGYYRSFTHFASQENIPFDKDDAAAKKAGFKGVTDIGSYLRSLIIKHRDSITRKIN